MVEESDIINFLKTRDGKASLNDVAEGLSIPKYGPNSAYALLQSLKTKAVIERRGELWTMMEEEAKPSEKTEEAIRPAQPTAEKEGAVSEVEKLMKAMAKTMAEAMKGAQTPSDEWELATKPLTSKIERKEEKLSALVMRPDAAPEAKKPLLGFPTGTFIDRLFLTSEGKSLNGVPICGQFAIAGLPGAGKSILIEEISIRVTASERKVLFATAEDTWKNATPRFDLQSRLKQKSEILGLDWNKVRENLFVLDTVAHPELQDWNTFAEAYRYAAEKEKIDLALIDSVTMLEAYRGTSKYRVMELARYNQVHGITALYINQRSGERDSYGIAESIGLAHSLDGTILVDYGRVYLQDRQVDLGLQRGEFARVAGVLDCRMCNFERRRVRVDITREGFLEALEPMPKTEVKSR